VRELARVGDFITIDRSVIALQNNFVAGKAFDNRSSLVALLEMLRALQPTKHAWDVYAVANVNEEDSATYVGALTSTFRIRPHLAICLDVTHAQQPGLHDDAAPRVGAGPCIARGTNVHPFVFEKLRAAAARAAIPHQVTVYGGDTETNAWMMQVAGEGAPTGLVEIPLRYMHTPVETIHPTDVANMAELLRAFVEALTPQDANVLQGETFVRATKAKHARAQAKRVVRTPTRGKKLKRKR
jgi:endoglucanase